MVNDPSPTAAEAEAELVMGYAPASSRAGLGALRTLDARLGEIIRAAREPLVGQMRLTWWHEALCALDDRAPPAEPILRALAAEVVSRGVLGGDLAAMIEGWEVLLDAPAPDEEALARHAAERGSRLFSLAARVLGGSDARVEAIGAGWALADLATHWSDPATAARARIMANDRLATVRGRAWPRPLRPLAAMALLAQSDLAGGVPGSPGRVARLLAMRLTGR